MTTIDVRGTSNLVRDALQVYADMQANKPAITKLATQDVLATRIAEGLIPALRQTYLDMAATQVEWQEKRFQAALTTAATDGTLLAGFSAATWQRWGVLMLALEAFLAQPIEALGGDTPKDALLQRYIAGEDEVVAPTPDPVPDPVPE